MAQRGAAPVGVALLLSVLLPAFLGGKLQLIATRWRLVKTCIAGQPVCEDLPVELVTCVSPLLCAAGPNSTTTLTLSLPLSRLQALQYTQSPVRRPAAASPHAMVLPTSQAACQQPQ